MRVVKTITFEGNREQLASQCFGSAPPGEYVFPNGLKVTIRVVEEPDDNKIHKAIHRMPMGFPHPCGNEGDHG